MLVVTHHRVRQPDAQGFLRLAREALDALSARPGWVRGTVGRAADDARQWVVVTEWADVGSYRRALTAYDVRVRATPLLNSAVEGSTAFEVLLQHVGEEITEHESSRAPGDGIV